MSLIGKSVIRAVAEKARETKNALAIRRLMQRDDISNDDLVYLAQVMAEIKDIQEMYYLIFEKALPARALNIIMEVIIPNVSLDNLKEILSDKKFCSDLSNLSAINVKLLIDIATVEDSISLKRLIIKKLPNVPDSFAMPSVGDLLAIGNLDKIEAVLKNKEFTKEEYSQIVDYLLYNADQTDKYKISYCLEICLRQTCLPDEKKMDALLYLASHDFCYDIEHYFSSLKLTETSKNELLKKLFEVGNIDLLLIFSKVVKLSNDEIIKLVDKVVETDDECYSSSIERIMLTNKLPEQCLTKCIEWMTKNGNIEIVHKYLETINNEYYNNNLTKPNKEQYLALFDVLVESGIAHAINIAHHMQYKLAKEKLDEMINITISTHKQGSCLLSDVANLSELGQLSVEQKKKLINYIVENLVENTNSSFSGLKLEEYERGYYHQLASFAKHFSNILTEKQKQKITKILLYDWDVGCYEIKNYIVGESHGFSEKFIDELTTIAVNSLSNYYYREYMEILPELQKNATHANQNISQ